MTYVTYECNISNRLSEDIGGTILKKIEDLLIIEKYYKDLGMTKLFNKDMKKHMKLIEFERNEYLSREGEELIQDSKFLKFTCESLAEKLDALSLNSSINLLYPLENRLASYINESLICKTEERDTLYIDFDENLVNVAGLAGDLYQDANFNIIV